jgi:hypothetical protein
MNTIRKYMKFGVIFAVAACCVLGVIVQSTPQQTTIIAKPTITALPTYTPSPEPTAEPTVDKKTVCIAELTVWTNDMIIVNGYIISASQAIKKSNLIEFGTAVLEAKKMYESMFMPTCDDDAMTAHQLTGYAIKHLGNVFVAINQGDGDRAVSEMKEAQENIELSMNLFRNLKAKYSK